MPSTLHTPLSTSRLRLLTFFCVGMLLSLTQRPILGQVSTAAELELAYTKQLSSAQAEERLDALVALSTLFKQTRRSAQPATVTLLGQLLTQELVPSMRSHAARTLEYAANPLAVQPLLAALPQEKDVATLKALLYALARYHEPPVTSALIPFLQHKETEIRGTAAFALAEQADTAAASALLEFLQKKRKDNDAFGRSQAARGLGRIGYKRGQAELVQALTQDKSPLVRREAATALGWLATLQEPVAVYALRAAANAEDPYLRANATAALAQIQQRQP